MEVYEAMRTSGGIAVVAVTALFLCGAARVAHAQGASTPPAGAVAPGRRTAAPAPAAGKDQTVAKAPTDLDRVRQRLLAPLAARLRVSDLPYFFVRATAPTVTFMDIAGSFDLVNGPAPAASVTPNEMMAYWRSPLSGTWPRVQQHVSFGDAVMAAAINKAIQHLSPIQLGGGGSRP